MTPAELQAALAMGERLGQRYALALPRSALAGRTGTLLGRAVGSSLDFQEHRDYQPGDDLRRIDWSIYARSDRLALKLYREEIDPHVDLVLDGSRSMALADTAKPQALARLAALLAVAAENAGCTHSVWIGQRGFRRLGNDRGRPSSWQDFSLDGVSSWAEDFQLLSPRWRSRGIRVLMGDLLWPADPAAVLRRVTEGASQVVVVQLLARADTQAPELGSLRLVDSETGEELDLFIDAEAAERYCRAVAQHQALWRQACRQSRAQWVTLEAESVVEADSVRPLEEIGLLLAT
jgi:uncharacterized protein (DUF58 family)